MHTIMLMNSNMISPDSHIFPRQPQQLPRSYHVPGTAQLIEWRLILSFNVAEVSGSALPLCMSYKSLETNSILAFKQSAANLSFRVRVPILLTYTQPKEPWGMGTEMVVLLQVFRDTHDTLSFQTFMG